MAKKAKVPKPPKEFLKTLDSLVWFTWVRAARIFGTGLSRHRGWKKQDAERQKKQKKKVMDEYCRAYKKAGGK